MKKHLKLLPILFAVLFLTGASGIARAQAGDKEYAFVVFETSVTKKGVETSDANPEEQRIYISNVVEFPYNSMNDRSVYRNASKVADEYFIANVSKPLEAKGILHKYYDDAIRINNRESYLDTRELVEEARTRVLENLKERNANVFTFNWTLDAKADGLETSQPRLLYRGAEQPLYGAAETKTPPTKTDVKPAVRKKND